MVHCQAWFVVVGLQIVKVKWKIKTKFQPEHLNQKLVARNNVSYEAQLQLCKLYDELESLIEEGNASLSVEVNREIADKIEQLEFNLQRLWGFLRVKCTIGIGVDLICAYVMQTLWIILMDRGIGRTIRLDCPLHRIYKIFKKIFLEKRTTFSRNKLNINFIP